jgi:hypothetical protein
MDNKYDFNLLMKLRKFIETFDKLIFNNPIDIKMAPKGSVGAIVKYVPRSDHQNECYIIEKRTDQELLNEIKLRKKSAKRIFSDERIIISIAAHEVRHRVQVHFKVNLLYGLIFERDRVKDKDLRDAIEFADNFYRDLMSRGIDLVKTIGLDKLREEYDAEIIGALVAKKWRGNNFSEIAEIIKSDSKKIRAFSPFLFLECHFMCREELSSIINFYRIYFYAPIYKNRYSYNPKPVMLKFF